MKEIFGPHVSSPLAKILGGLAGSFLSCAITSLGCFLRSDRCYPYGLGTRGLLSN